MDVKVRGTVDKWFDETLSHVQARSERMRQLDTLLLGILHCAREYCNGILVLLLPEDRHRLPATALVRVFCEVCLKLLWCLQAPDKTDSPDKDSCWQRLRRWDYQRARERKRMLEKLRDANCAALGGNLDEELEQAEQDVQEYKNKSLRCMPDVAGICKQLAKWQQGWAAVYPECFQNFSRAVHLDMGLIRQMVQPSGNETRSFADPPMYDSATLLHYCLAMACDINLMVRRHYNGDCEEMQQEYNTLKEQLSKTQEDG